MASASSSSSKEDKLEGWTTEEKFQFLEGLRAVGMNAEKIKDFVKNKTEDEIRVALDHYTKKALKLPPAQTKRERKVKVPPEPLADWAKFVLDAHGVDQFPVETAAALRLIAEFEDRPSPHLTENIDFKKIYHTLADALEGKPIKIDKNTEYVLNKCMVETALMSKTLSKGETFKNILKSACNPETADVSAFATPTEDIELNTLRHISSKKNFNPLNIPENNLKFSSQTN